MKKIVEVTGSVLVVVAFFGAIIWGSVREYNTLQCHEAFRAEIVSLTPNEYCALVRGREYEWTGNYDHYSTNTRVALMSSNNVHIGDSVWVRRNTLHGKNLYTDVRVPPSLVRKILE